MGRRQHVRLILVLEVLVMLAITIEGVKVKVSKTFSSCVTSKDDTLVSFVRISFERCAEECIFRPSCKAMEYRNSFKQCNLYSKDNVALFKGRCIFAKRSDIASEIRKPCGDLCVNGEVCDLETNQCVKSECKELTIQNGSLVGNQNTIGSVKKFFCHTKCVEQFPMTSIRCLEDGIWSYEPICKELVNVAFGTNVSMSSQFDMRSTPELLVDGAASGIWPCACTKQEMLPWILVDLGQTHQIFCLNIYNRNDCCSERLHSLEISIGESMTSLNACVEFPSILDPIMQTLIPKEACTGRFVKLQIVDVNAVNFLTICELEVMGYPVSD